MDEDKANKLRKEILDVSIKQAEKCYDELYKVYASLDGKVQSSVTICGFAIASSVAFVKWDGIAAAKQAGNIGLLMLCFGLPIVLALVALGLCVCAMFTAQYPLPYTTKSQIKEAKEIFDQLDQDLTLRHQENYLYGQLTSLATIVAEAGALRETKAKKVRIAQVAAIVSIVVLAITFCVYYWVVS